MAIAVTCPHCGKTMKVKDEFAGKKGKCPACMQSIAIPQASTDASPPRMANPALMSARVATATPAEPRVTIVAEPLPTSVERSQANQWRSSVLSKLPTRMGGSKTSFVQSSMQLVFANIVVSLCLGYMGVVLAIAAGSVTLAIWGPTSWQLGSGVSFGVAAMGLLLALVLIKPFAANWFSKREGYVLQAAKEPEMFAILEKLQVAFGLSNKVSVRLPMAIVAKAEVGDGLVRSMLGRNVHLQIGLPLLAGCSLEQVTALLALPLARYGQGRLTRIVCGGHAWLSRIVKGEDVWDIEIQARLNDSTRRLRKLWMPAKVLSMIPRVVAWPFWFVADLLVGASVDASEEEAVKLQAELVGAKVPGKAAGQLGLLEFGWQGVAADVLFQHREKRLVDDLISQMQKNLAELPEEVQALVSQPLPDDPKELALRHLSLQQQQEVLSQTSAAGQFASAEPARMLLRDFVTTCREATWEYYLRRLGPRIQQRKDLLPTA